MAFSYNPFDQALAKSTALKGPKAFRGVSPYSDMENFKIDNPEEYQAMIDSAGGAKLPPKKKIWDSASEAAAADTTDKTADTTAAATPTSSGTPYRSSNPLQFIDNLAGGIGSQIPSTAGSIVGFGGDLVGAINPYSDVTFKGLLKGPQSEFAKTANEYGDEVKKNLQEINNIDPNSMWTKTGEGITDVAGSLLGPNKLKLLADAGKVGKVANIVGQGTLDATKYSVASEGRLPTKGEAALGIGIRGAGEVVSGAKGLYDSIKGGSKVTDQIAKGAMQKATGLTPIELDIQNTAPDLFKKFAGLNKAEQAKSVVEDVTKVVDNIEEAIKTQQGLYKQAAENGSSAILPPKKIAAVIQDSKIDTSRRGLVQSEKEELNNFNSQLSQLEGDIIPGTKKMLPLTGSQMIEAVSGLVKLRSEANSDLVKKLMSEKIIQLKEIIKADKAIGPAYAQAEKMTPDLAQGRLSVPESFKDLIKNRDASPEMIDRAIAELQGLIGKGKSNVRTSSNLVKGNDLVGGVPDIENKLKLYKESSNDPSIRSMLYKTAYANGLPQYLQGIGSKTANTGVLNQSVESASNALEPVKKTLLKYVPGVGYVRKKVKDMGIVPKAIQASISE